MPDTSGPWDGLPWAEADWYRHLTLTLPCGVDLQGATVAAATDGPLAWAASGLTLTPAIGRAVVGGGGYVRTAALTSVTATANAHATFSRRDRLVLRRSLTTHTVALVVITGTAASSPVAPAITRTDTLWDLPLFSFLVPPASGTTITGIIDERSWLTPAGEQAFTSGARDAIAAQGLRQTDANNGDWLYSGGVWTQLNVWTELISSTSYSWSVPVNVNAQPFPTIAAGTSDVVVTVPVGRTLEVELSLPACTVAASTTAFARLTDVGASVYLDAAAYSTPAGVSSAFSTKLTGRVLGTGATVTVRPQAWVIAGGLTIAASATAAASVKLAWRVS